METKIKKAGKAQGATATTAKPSAPELTAACP